MGKNRRHMKKYLPLLFVICSGVVRAQSGEIWVDAGASSFANKAIGETDPAGDQIDVQLDNGFRVFDWRSIPPAISATSFNTPTIIPLCTIRLATSCRMTPAREWGSTS